MLSKVRFLAMIICSFELQTMEKKTMILKIDKWNKTVNTVFNDKIVPMPLQNNDGKLLEYDINLGSYIGCRYADIGDENTRKFFDLYKHINGNHMSNNLLKWCHLSLHSS